MIRGHLNSRNCMYKNDSMYKMTKQIKPRLHLMSQQALHLESKTVIITYIDMNII